MGGRCEEPLTRLPVAKLSGIAGCCGRCLLLGCLLLGFPYPRAISESKEVPYWGGKLGQQGGAQPTQVLPSGSPGGQALH